MSRSASCAARAARPLSPAERWSAITVARLAVVADALGTRRCGRNNLAVAQIVARLDSLDRALILGDDPTVLSPGSSTVRQVGSRREGQQSAAAAAVGRACRLG